MFLIDGYNLLHALVRGKTTDSAREQLIDLIVEFCSRGGYQAKIVFDPTGGMKRRDQRGSVEIHNARPGETADDVILGFLQLCDDPMLYTVISNDREVVKEARKSGYKVLSCAEFGRRIAARPEAPDKKEGASPGEVDYWMREFGLEDEP